jgi:hypothetical protein
MTVQMSEKWFDRWQKANEILDKIHVKVYSISLVSTDRDQLESCIFNINELLKEYHAAMVAAASESPEETAVILPREAIHKLSAKR